MIIVYGEPIIDLIIVLIFPRFINEYGIYITMPVSNFILMIASILLYKKSNKSLSK
jgi:Na+-driven multidrug efflux pump